MAEGRQGQVAVLFVSQRTAADEAGYAAAGEQMEALAAAQPGFAGVASTRDATGLGMTVSYWTDAASAAAWRDHPEHVRIRDAGRARWYAWYEVVVSTVARGYRWSRD